MLILEDLSLVRSWKREDFVDWATRVADLDEGQKTQLRSLGIRGEYFATNLFVLTKKQLMGAGFPEILAKELAVATFDLNAQGILCPFQADFVVEAHELEKKLSGKFEKYVQGKILLRCNSNTTPDTRANFTSFPVDTRSEFPKIREGMLYFKDFTGVIKGLADTEREAIMLLRPRRFGKSLLLSVLENFYDINKKQYFDFLFKVLCC